MKRILIINGPNMNMLGKRKKDHYGSKTLDDIYEMLKAENANLLDLDFFQSNHEGAILDYLHDNYGKADAIIINPAAFTHTSVALRDALEIFDIIKVEVHLSEVDNREDFRKINYIRDVCTKTIQGFKEESYIYALKYLKKEFNML